MAWAESDGSLYYEKGDHFKSEDLFKEALEINKKLLKNQARGEHKADIAAAVNLNNLGALYYSRGLYHMAEPLFKQALELKTAAPIFP